MSHRKRWSVDTAHLPVPAGLPAGVRAYSQSPVFDRDTIPDALKRDHSTKADVWAVIHVLDGALRYRVENAQSDEVLTPLNPGLVRPQQPHAVRADGPVRFVVEFYAAGDAGDPHA